MIAELDVQIEKQFRRAARSLTDKQSNGKGRKNGEDSTSSLEELKNEIVTAPRAVLSEMAALIKDVRSNPNLLSDNDQRSQVTERFEHLKETLDQAIEGATKALTDSLDPRQIDMLMPVVSRLGGCKTELSRVMEEVMAEVKAEPSAGNVATAANENLTPIPENGISAPTSEPLAPASANQVSPDTDQAIDTNQCSGNLIYHSLPRGRSLFYIDRDGVGRNHPHPKLKLIANSGLEEKWPTPPPKPLPDLNIEHKRFRGELAHAFETAVATLAGFPNASIWAKRAYNLGVNRVGQLKNLCLALQGEAGSPEYEAAQKKVAEIFLYDKLDAPRKRFGIALDKIPQDQKETFRQIFSTLEKQLSEHEERLRALIGPEIAPSKPLGVGPLGSDNLSPSTTRYLSRLDQQLRALPSDLENKDGVQASVDHGINCIAALDKLNSKLIAGRYDADEVRRERKHIEDILYKEGFLKAKKDEDAKDASGKKVKDVFTSIARKINGLFKQCDLAQADDEFEEIIDRLEAGGGGPHREPPKKDKTGPTAPDANPEVDIKELAGGGPEKGYRWEALRKRDNVKITCDLDEHFTGEIVINDRISGSKIVYTIDDTKTEDERRAVVDKLKRDVQQPDIPFEQAEHLLDQLSQLSADAPQIDYKVPAYVEELRNAHPELTPVSQSDSPIDVLLGRHRYQFRDPRGDIEQWSTFRIQKEEGRYFVALETEAQSAKREGAQGPASISFEISSDTDRLSATYTRHLESFLANEVPPQTDGNQFFNSELITKLFAEAKLARISNALVYDSKIAGEVLSDNAIIEKTEFRNCPLVDLIFTNGTMREVRFVQSFSILNGPVKFERCFFDEDTVIKGDISGSVLNLTEIHGNARDLRFADVTYLGYGKGEEPHTMVWAFKNMTFTYENAGTKLFDGIIRQVSKNALDEILAKENTLLSAEGGAKCLIAHPKILTPQPEYYWPGPSDATHPEGPGFFVDTWTSAEQIDGLKVNFLESGGAILSVVKRDEQDETVYKVVGQPKHHLTSCEGVWQCLEFYRKPKKGGGFAEGTIVQVGGDEPSPDGDSSEPKETQETVGAGSGGRRNGSRARTRRK